MPFAKKVLIALLAAISWLILLAAMLATSTVLTVNNLNHAGSSTSAIVRDFAKNQTALSSVLDEFKKNADPKTALQIEKNRATIEKTISSLGASKEFQDSLASPINQISQAVLNGSSSVKVNFHDIVSLVAEKVNAAAKNTVIGSKDLAKIKPQTLDIRRQSEAVHNIRNNLKLGMLLWLLWLALLGTLFLLKGMRAIRTSGGQLLSVGILLLILRSAAPAVAEKLLKNSTLPTYQRDLIPLVFNTLTTSIVIVSIVASIVGFALLILERLFSKKSQLSSN